MTDAPVDGVATWNSASGWVTARLTVRPDGGQLVRLTARWRPFGTQKQPAVIRGYQGARRLAATCPAP